MPLNDGLPNLSTATPAPGANEEPDEGTPGSQPAEGEEALEGEQPEGEEGDDGADAWEVTEIDGLQVAVPKGKAEEVKAGFLKAKDYTTKTQEVADKRREVEAREAELNTRAEVLTKYRGEIAKIEAIKGDLKKYEDLTPQQWAELSKNPQEYAGHQANYQRLSREHNAAIGALQKMDTERREAAQRDTAKRLADGRAVVARDIPGWNDEAAARVQATARSIGFTDQEWESAFEDPRLIRLAHLASVGEAALKKPAPNLPKVPAAPLKTVGTRSPAPAGLSDKLEIGEWMKRFDQKRQHRKMG